MIRGDVSGGMEKRKTRERGERNKSWEECWTKAVPTWGRLEDIQLSLDGKELPLTLKLISWKGCIAHVIFRYLSLEFLIKENC